MAHVTEVCKGFIKSWWSIWLDDLNGENRRNYDNDAVLGVDSPYPLSPSASSTFTNIGTFYAAWVNELVSLNSRRSYLASLSLAVPFFLSITYTLHGWCFMWQFGILSLRGGLYSEQRTSCNDDMSYCWDSFLWALLLRKPWHYSNKNWWLCGSSDLNPACKYHDRNGYDRCNCWVWMKFKTTIA